MPAAGAPGQGGSQRGYSLPKVAPRPAPKPVVAARPRPAPPASANAVARASQRTVSPSTALTRQNAAVNTASKPISPSTALTRQNAAVNKAAASSARDVALIRQLLNHRLSESIQHQGQVGIGGRHAAAITAGLIKQGDLTTKIVGNIAKDLVNLPASTLQGAEQVGAAAAHDISHGTIGSFHLQGSSSNDMGSQIAQLAQQAWKQSVTKHLVEGDFSGALKTFSEHPVYGASEVAGNLGLAGRLAGAAGRSGLLGSRAAEIASTAREPLPTTAGLASTPQHYSRNLLTKGVQVGTEQLKHHTPALTARAVKRELVKRTDELHATADARTQHAVSTIVQHLKDSMPTTRKLGIKRAAPAAGVVPHAVMGMAGPESHFVQGMQGILDELKTHEANLSGKELRLNQAHQANIQNFLADPNMGQVLNSAHETVLRQNALDEALAQHGLLAPDQAVRRAVEPYVVMGHMGPDVKLLPKDSALPTQRRLDAAAAYKDVQSLAREATHAPAEHKLNLAKVREQGIREVRDARQRLDVAKRQAAKAEGVLTGRHGLNDPLPPHAADRMNRYLDRVHQAEQDLEAARQHRLEALKQQRQFGKDAIAAAKDNYRTAKEQYTVVHKPYRSETAHGVVRVTPDETAAVVPTNEITSHMAESGVNPTAYIKQSVPADSLRDAFGSKFRFSRGGSRGKAYTGAGLKPGIWTPGYESIARSQIGSMARLQRAITNDEFVKGAAIKDETGSPLYYDDIAAKKAADAYNASHDVKVEVLPAHPAGIDEAMNAKIKAGQGHGAIWEHPPEAAAGPHDRFVLVPKVMADRWAKHLEVDANRSGSMARFNRQFRNSVLPFSTKWLMGNVTEAAARSALVGAGPRDWHLADSVIGRMRELGLHNEADHLERMATGGLHYGMNESMNREIMGLNPGGKSPGVVARTLQNTPVLKHIHQGYTGVVQGIFHFNRVVESNFEKAVLGAHMKRQMQEFSGSWMQAVNAQQKYLDKLAKGYADPQLAADAGRYVHETLGQYDRFSPKMRQFTRSIAPFAPWYLNAAKFVYHTLPLKHPLTQAILLDVSRANQQQWTANHGVPHDNFFGMPVGDLLSAAKVGPSAYLNVGRYLPEGAFTPGPVDYGLNMMLPQASGAIHALLGQDPFGRTLTGPDGQKVTDSGQRASQALSEFLAGFTGPVNQLHRIVAEHGSTPYNTEKLWDWNPKLKPGTHHGDALGLARVFDPLMPTFLKQNSQTTTGPHIPKVTGGPTTGPGHVPKVLNPDAMLGGKKVKTSTPAQNRQFLAQIHQDWSKMRKQGYLPPGAKFPKIVIDKNHPLSQPVPYVLGKVFHISPELARLAVSKSNGQYNNWARETVIHELAHTMQGAGVRGERTRVEGGAQAYTDMVAPHIIPHFQDPGDGYYKLTNANFAREPHSWLTSGQFTNKYAPPINLPTGGNFKPTAAYLSSILSSAPIRAAIRALVAANSHAGGAHV